MASIRQNTNYCLPFKILVLSHFGLKIRALKRWCVFKSAQCIVWLYELAFTTTRRVLDSDAEDRGFDPQQGQVR